MENPYIYYIPIYPDDDFSEALTHLFSGQKGLDDEIIALLHELDDRERRGEGVDYVKALEDRINIKHLDVHQLHRDRNRFVTAQK